MHVFDHTIKPILLYGSDKMNYLQFDTHSIFSFPYLKLCLISLSAILKIRILVLLVLTVRHQSLQYVLVKQEDNLNPSLFKIFVNDLPSYLSSTSDP
jgi:hypothetical protein